MKILATAFDMLAIAIAIPALLATAFGLANHQVLPAWFGLFTLAIAAALFAGATPGRGWGHRAAGTVCVLTAVLPTSIGAFFVWIGPSADSGSWASVIFGWIYVAYGASFVALALTTILRSGAALPAGIALALTCIVSQAFAAFNDEGWRPLAVAIAGLAAPLAAVSFALSSPQSRCRLSASGATVASALVAAQAFAFAWLAFFPITDEARTSDPSSVRWTIAALALSLAAVAVVAWRGYPPIVRAVVRIPAFGAAAAVVFLLAFDARFPGTEAMLLLAGAALTYAYALAHPRERRLLPAVEVAALPIAAIVLFTEVPGFGLALALAGAVVVSEWLRGQASPPAPTNVLG